MSAWIEIECDRIECLDAWSTDQSGALSGYSVEGAMSYLTDMEMWTIGADGESIFCSHRCKEIVEEADV